MLGAVPTVHDGRGLSVCVLVSEGGLQWSCQGPEDVLEKCLVLHVCTGFNGVGT